VGLSRWEAQAYWREEHARLFKKVPGLLSYVQNHSVLDSRGEPILGDPGFDIFSEVEFADEAKLTKAVTGPYYQGVILPDETRLLDASRRTFLLTRRHVLSGAPSAELHKVTLLLQSDAPLVCDRLTTVVEPDASAVAACAHTVYEVGGTLPRPIALVLQHYFRSLEDARRWGSQYSSGARLSAALSVVAAVVATEVEVVPRASSVSFVH